jgi:hypothetical protein
MPTNNTPAGDSLISNLPTASALLGTEQIPLDSVLSGTLTTTKISTASLAAQLLNLAPLVIINDAQITNSTINSTTIGLTTPAAGNFTSIGLTPGTGSFTTLTVSGLSTQNTINASGQINFTAGIASTSKTTGTLVITGGLGVSGTVTANEINAGGIDSTPIGATTPATGAFTTLTANGATTFTAGTASSSTTTGTVVVTGGVGVSGAIYAGSVQNTPVGSTTASSGAFTTLSASSTVSGTGFSTYLASPPAIGGTAPAAGSFTTLSATGTLTGFVGRLINIQYFFSSGTYTPTTGTTSVVIQAWGAGGQGGGVPNPGSGQTASGGGGSGGAFMQKRLTSGFSGATVTVGAGGSGGGSGTGGAGGNSSFTASYVAAGGAGGSSSGGLTVTLASILSSPGNGAASTGGDLNGVTPQGGYGIWYSSGQAQSGYGGAGFLGQQGAAPVINGSGAGKPGQVQGSGGSGANAFGSGGAFSGGAGGGGLVIVYEYS